MGGGADTGKAKGKGKKGKWWARELLSERVRAKLERGLAERCGERLALETMLGGGIDGVGRQQ